MSGGLVIDIDTVDALSPTLRRLRAAATDLSEPMAESSEVMLEGTLERFQEQVDPLGTPWKRSKDAIKEGRPTLRKSGDLYNAIERQSDQDSAGVGVYRTGGPAKYARAHQDGAVIKHPGGTAFFERDGWAMFVSNETADRFERLHGRALPRTQPHDIVMPRRQFLGFSDDDIMAIDRILVGHLLRAMDQGASA